MTITVLGICGSLRRDSKNKQALIKASQRLPQGCQFELADLTDMPFFNADLSEKPEAVQRFLAQCQRADALLLACPEYNYSVAPALKNALDWASREPNNALLAGKPAAILGVGGGMGTSRAQYHLRQIGVYLDLHFVNKPEIFINGFGPSFDAEGQLVDDKVLQLMEQQMQALVAMVKA